MTLLLVILGLGVYSAVAGVVYAHRPGWAATHGDSANLWLTLCLLWPAVLVFLVVVTPGAWAYHRTLERRTARALPEARARVVTTGRVVSVVSTRPDNIALRGDE